MKYKIFHFQMLVETYRYAYHEDLEKRGGCGVVAHERHESHGS